MVALLSWTVDSRVGSVRWEVRRVIVLRWKRGRVSGFVVTAVERTIDGRRRGVL
jgi:hypothetical protein